MTAKALPGLTYAVRLSNVATDRPTGLGWKYPASRSVGCQEDQTAVSGSADERRQAVTKPAVLQLRDAATIYSYISSYLR